MRAKLGLNIGCGNCPTPDSDEIKWINIEPFYTHDNPLFNKELMKRFHIFPVKAQEVQDFVAHDSFDVIYIVHTLEHICSDDAESVIKECWDLLRPDGYIEIETPDLDKACKLWLDGDQSDRVLGLFYGGKTNEPGQLHQTGFNFKRFQKLLSGYKSVEEVPVGAEHDRAEPEYDIRVRAYK